jgi:hypothetical protein
MPERTPRERDKLLAFVFGAIFLVLLLAVFLVVLFVPPEQTTFSEQILGYLFFICRVILALAAAGVAAVIPGFLQIQWLQHLGAGSKFVIRGVGAIAVFIIVYMINPPAQAIRLSYDSGLDRCRSAIGTLPGDPSASAGIVCMSLMTTDPARWEGYYELGRLNYALGNYSLAKDNVQDALKWLAKKNSIEIAAANSDDLKQASPTDVIQVMYLASMVHAGLEDYPTGRHALQIVAGLTGQTGAVPDQRMNTEATVGLAALWLAEWLKSNGDTGAPAFINAKQLFMALDREPHTDPILAGWVQYYLACTLANEARFRAGSLDGKEATVSTINLINYALQTMDDQVYEPHQPRMLKCLLTGNQHCRRYPADPLLCPALVDLVAQDTVLAGKIRN